MEEIKKHINDTNASYRDINAGDAKNTDLFLDNEHFDFFKDCGDRITVRFHKTNLTQAILFISSILPRKFDQSAAHTIIDYSDEFVFNQLAILNKLFENGETFTQVWNARKDVPQKNGKIDNRFYFNGLLQEIQYRDSTGSIRKTKFTVRNYLAGGFSDLIIRKSENGIFDIFIENVTKSPYNDGKEEGLEETNNSIKTLTKKPLLQIYYGAPGTGKSHEIKAMTRGKKVIRTTFHPDSDYSTFVGAYKPTSRQVVLRDLSGHPVSEDGKLVMEDKIFYEFVPQAFLQAYTLAWKAFSATLADEMVEDVYLVIEEINRGNCAQVFGDLFQLLDRNNAGFSDYPIKADNDMKKQLVKAFADIHFPQKDAINYLYDSEDVVAQVLAGEVLLLPNNLFIWATMNTSDQSLFPIDSAFKRRWDWKYLPISNANKNWRIEANGNFYDWWQFLQSINERIGSTTNSEDKKLGYFFCKAQNGIITAETFVGKVVFYLWNDVFKDYGFDDDIFKNTDGTTLSFDKFYTAKSIDETTVEQFLMNLELQPVDSLEDEEYNGQKETEEEQADDFSKFNITQKKRYDFWNAFFNHAQTNEEFSKHFGGTKTPTKDHWKNFFLSGKDYHFVINQFRKKGCLQIEVYFDKTTETFHKFVAHKEEIENNMGTKYEWNELPEKKASRIIETKENVDYDNENEWLNYFDFCIERLLRMREVFPKYEE